MSSNINHTNGGTLTSNGQDPMSTDQGREDDGSLIEQERALAQKASENKEEWINHCRELVQEYRRLLQESKSSYYKKEGDVGYLISMKWLDHWKKSVYYDSLYRNQVPEFDEERPTEVGEIDNVSLVRPAHEILGDTDPNSYYNFILKKDLKMNYDYKPVDEDTWNFFHCRYGGIPIKRYYYKSYSFGADIEAKLKEYKVKVLPSVDEWDLEKVSDTFRIFTSKHAKFTDLLERIVAVLNSDQYGYNLKVDGIRPWKLAFNRDLKEVDEPIKKAIEENMEEEEEPSEGHVKVEKNTGVKFPGLSMQVMRDFEIEDLEVTTSDTLVLEQASDSGKFIFYYEEIKVLCYGKCEYCYSHKPLVIQCKCEEVKYCSEECLKKDERFHIDKCSAPVDYSDTKFEKKDRARNGLTGLQNLGNTCFMNSSIQCLSNTFSLIRFFLTEKFKEDINTENVLGTQGKLAVQFARLLNEMWNDEAPVVTPWSFKKVVGNFQPMFSGFAQHDSAELLSFVLDGLHEDLNRVIKKPYYELPEIQPHVSEKIKAELAWKAHLLRNQSVIVDLMQGQYKSTLCCPKCNNVSITYDPYMMLSLPIPQNEVYSSLVYYMPYDSRKCPIKSKFYLKKSANMMDLRKQIAEQMECDPWSFILCNIEAKALVRMFCRNRTIGELSEEEGCLFAFEIDPEVFQNQRDPEAYKELNKLLQNSDSAVDMSNDDDYNNSISRDWVKVPVQLNRMDKSKYSYYERRTPISFPRIIWINRNWDLITVHKKVFNYLRYYFDFNLQGQSEDGGEEFKDLSEEQAFRKIFEGLDSENYRQKLSNADDPGEFTYSLNMVNPEKKSFYSSSYESLKPKKFPYFGAGNYDNTPLPFTAEEDLTFGDLIDEYFMEYDGQDDSDDEMGFGGFQSAYDDDKKEEEKSEKNLEEINRTNDGFFHETSYHGSKNTIFELEIFWNKKKDEAATHKLDRCKKHARFSEISEVADRMNSEDITLEQCFESFMTPEMLGKDNAWYCRKCKDHVEAMKKMELYSTPPILFVSLKRFKSGRGSYFKDKLEDKVHFPLDELDISDIVISNKDEEGNVTGEVKYELFAVSNHYGNMGFGHYTAYARNPTDGKWYDFDDSSVTEVTHPSSVVSEAAYNLFFRRKDFEFTEDIDYDALKQTCDFEEFKLEVGHYAVPEEPKEEENKNSGDAEMADV